MQVGTKIVVIVKHFIAYFTKQSVSRINKHLYSRKKLQYIATATTKVYRTVMTKQFSVAANTLASMYTSAVAPSTATHRKFCKFTSHPVAAAG